MRNDIKYRNLTPEEISRLEQQACTAVNWGEVKVVEKFRPDYIRNTHFSGDVYLGHFEREYVLEGGARKHAGLQNITLHHCVIGNDVLIENVQNYIANYDIADNCFIQNVNLMLVEGESTFGNGTEVTVLNEMGGREVPIFNELSAHLAYIIALYRHYPLLIERLKVLIEEYAAGIRSTMGRVERGCRIVNTGSIRNVFIGECCVIDGTSRLQNGSLNSNREAPIYIGHNVMAEDFIISSGAHITDGVTMSRCFIGQACHLGHLFSAHDSLFFSNCQGENGEACAVFAGPYTVTMHKSSLLIAGMFSFLNAGSGSNQSNHLYKLGPIHQGIIERGSKTTSDSYILWPAKIGAFSLIMGRHVSHPDTSDLPFSYLIEQNNQTYLVPGVNLRSVGTIRDAQKWPKRDKRTDSRRLDSINFNLLSPYTIRKMLSGLDVLHTLKRVSGETSEEYTYQSVHIKNRALYKGIQFYSMAIHKFLGNSLIKRLENRDLKSDADIRRCLKPDMEQGSGEWVDLSGIIAPQKEIEHLIRRIEEGEIKCVAEIVREFEWLHDNYYRMEWTWTWEVMQTWYDVTLETVTAADIVRIVKIWKETVVSLDKMLYEDAKKEFSLTARTGFGVDGTTRQKEIDFEQVRGAFENNPFVEAVQEHIQVKTALAEELIQRIDNINA